MEAVSGDTAEVTNTGQSDIEQTVDEFIHSFTAQGNLATDAHALTQLEVCNRLTSLGNNGLLTGNDGKVTYTVTVTDEQGNPISGMMVQLCKDACIPAVVDANGTATWTVAEDDYKVSFLNLPDGYTYTTEETEFYFADGETSMTIVLKAEA